MRKPNIIFVMLDTMRVDSLGVYGGKKRLKTLDSIASKGTLYLNAIAPGTYTLPSHTSIFTSKRVARISSLKEGMLGNYRKNTDPFLSKNRYIGEKEMTLARKLSYMGYKTSLFSNNPFITETTGLASGFSYVKNMFIEQKLKEHKATLGIVDNDSMREGFTKLAYMVSRLIPRKQLDSIYLSLRNKLNYKFAEGYGFNRLDQGAEITNKMVRKYAGKHNSGQFIFINYMEAHEGYPTNLITDRFVSQDKWLYVGGILESNDVKIIKEAYDKRVEYLDSKVGELISALKEKGMLDNAVVLFTSDHGQAFMEHGQLYHTLFPYNEISHVPLIAARYLNGKQVPSRERIEENVSLSSLHNSILDIAYGKSEMLNGSMRSKEFVFSDHTGISEVWDAGLLELLKGRSEYASRIYEAKKAFNTLATAIYSGKYKLIHYYNARKDELYDLSMDSGEEENIIDGHRDIAYTLLKANSAS